jgi:uncharacterized membrane protein YuzA (DUF378 family)
LGRRSFLASAAGVTAASYLRILGAADTLQLGVIGVNIQQNIFGMKVIRTV